MAAWMVEKKGEKRVATMVGLTVEMKVEERAV